MTCKQLLVTILLGVMFSGATPARADDEPPAVEPPGADQPAEDAEFTGRTPPRLSFTDGEVSFWRPGAADWAPARINTPLAPGDALYTGAGANLELQVGARAFVRAGENTQIGLDNQEPDFLQFRVTAGHVSLDLRGLQTGQSVEVDTPNAVFSIERTGYYRIDITDDTTTFAARRGGRAAMTPAGGAAVEIAPSEQAVVQGTDTPRVQTYAAPELDAWDRWNYVRTDHLIDAVSARYLPAGEYGADGLDHYGSWRVVETYGPVWVPDGVAAEWAPYSTGRWIWDPYYGWTWLDDAPWGWAPYHYGRWVHPGNCWAWAPGPLVATPVYAPALVAFFGGSGFGARVGLATPVVGWVALGWGEPVLPWWGHPGFVGRPHWCGWGGPRVVDNMRQISLYQNVGVHDAVLTMRRDRFGQTALQSARLRDVDLRHLQPVQGVLPVQAGPVSLVGGAGRAPRPPEAVWHRPVIGTRPPHDSVQDLRGQGWKRVADGAPPTSRLVPSPRRPHAPLLSARPPFAEGNAPERARPPLPPRFQGNWHQEPVGTTGAAPPPVMQLGPEPASDRHWVQPVAPPQAPRPSAPTASRPQAEGPRPPSPRGAAPAAAPAHRDLPGEPANRVFPGWPQTRAHRAAPAPPHGEVGSAPPAPVKARGDSAHPSQRR